MNEQSIFGTKTPNSKTSFLSSLATKYDVTEFFLKCFSIIHSSCSEYFDCMEKNCLNSHEEKFQCRSLK